MNYVASASLIAFGLLVILNQRHWLHLVAGMCFIAAGLLFLAR